MTSRPLKDDSLMPWGKYGGKQMIDVPAEYLLYMKDVKKISPGTVLDYINDREQFLRDEVKAQKK